MMLRPRARCGAAAQGSLAPPGPGSTAADEGGGPGGCGYSRWAPMDDELPPPNVKKPHIQPWKEYWPPKPGGDLYRKLMASYPDVLTWKYDSYHLFEQPWRDWSTGSYAGSGETSTDKTAVVSAPEKVKQPLGITESATELPTPVASADVDQRRRALDGLIDELGLPSVLPPDFNYLARISLYLSEKPFRCQIPRFKGYKMGNIQASRHDVTIFNVAGHEDRFVLDEAGFEFTKCPVTLERPSDDVVKDIYLPSLSQWLKGFLGCEQVFLYAYNFRHSNGSNNSQKDWKPPFFRAHCDGSNSTHLNRLQLYFPDTWKKLLSRRIRLINVWKPLSTPVQDCPLAMCDFRTVESSDLIPMDLVYPHLQDEAFEVFHNPNHRWFYKKDMEWNDAIVFKLHDTLDTVATVCPHSAFLDPSVPDGIPPRTSIEVKAIVIG